MQDSDKILSRLIGILKKLANNETPKVKELALFFDVTQRTIQRDLYQRLSHFPIEKNSQGALQFVNGFSLEQALLDNDEMLLTYFALCKMKEDNPHFDEKIHKILKKLVKPKNKIAQQTVQKKKAKTPSKESLKKIEDAILTNRVLQVDCAQKPVTIKPYKLHNHKNKYTLIGEDCDDGKIKSIQLSNIIDVHIQKQRFKIKRSLEETLNNVHTAFFHAHNARVYEAIISKEIAQHFIKNKVLPSQEILTEDENGNIEVKFIADSEHQVENIIKHWIPHIKITKPVDYSQKFISKMQHYINHCMH